MTAKRILLIVAACLLVSLPCAAEDEAFATGLKFAAEKSIGQLASMGYKINCKAKNLDYKSDDSWYCGVFAKLSGEDKAEFEERVQHNLTKIRADLADIKTAISEIQEGQERIYNQNQRVLLRLDEIGPETTIGRDLAQIRTVYNEQYVPLFNGERSFTVDRLRAFAHQIVFVTKVHDLLGVVNDQLTQPQIAGREPLLRAYAKREYEKLRTEKGSLEPSYLYLESVVDGLIADQRKGYVMYVWATETLQSDCEMAERDNAPDKEKRCRDYRTFPHTAEEYRKTFQDHVRAQLDEMNAGVEYMVLAGADTHARHANFLPSDAERVFARSDLFTAGNLGEGFGIRGRVISMGNAFNGKLKVQNAEWSPVDTPSKVATYGGRVDWWKSTAGNAAYDELHFDDRWVVYHYHAKQAGPGTYAIQTPMPVAPAIKVTDREIDGRKVPFGSFVGIARAGGGYALLSGDWNSDTATRTPNAVGDLSQGWNDFLFEPAKMLAGIKYSGSLEWHIKNAPGDQYIEAARSSFAISKKSIRYPEGGELTLRADFGDTYPMLCPNGACADIPHNGVLLRYLDYSKPLINGRDARMDVRAEFVIDENASGSNGFVWKREGTTGKGFDDRDEAGKETTRIRLDAKPRQLIFGSELKMNVQTSTTSASRWRVAAPVMIENAYVTQ